MIHFLCSFQLTNNIISGWSLFRNADIYLLPSTRTHATVHFRCQNAKWILTSGLPLDTVACIYWLELHSSMHVVLL